MDLNAPPKKSVVLAVLGLVALLWLLARFAGPSPELLQPVAMPPISLESLEDKPVQQGNLEERYPHNDSWDRDPFALPHGISLKSLPALEETEGKGEQKQKPPPRLTAILMSGSRRLAVIDERVVYEGDLFNGERIVRISADRVILRGSEGRRILRVPQPQTQIKSKTASGSFLRQ